MNGIKKDKKKLDDDARLKARLSNPTSNPIDNVVGMMLKKDAKSCKLASARLSQIENNKKEYEEKKDNKK